VVDGPASADFRAIKIMFDLIWETDSKGQTQPASPETTAFTAADENGHRTAQGAVLEGDA